MKKVLAMILTALMLLCLPACGQAEKVPVEEIPAAGDTSLTWQEQYDLGLRYLSEGKYEEAILAFTAVIEVEPNHTLAYLGRADAYIGSGETTETLSAALADYDKVIALEQGNVDGWLGLADVYIRQGEFNRAEKVLQEALTHTANDSRVQEKLTEMASGRITDAAGRERFTTGFNEQGSPVWHHLTRYDQAGRRAEILHYDANMQLLGTVECIYDAEGNEIQGTDGYFTSSGNLRPTTYIRNSAGEVTEKHTYNYGGALIERVQLEWNEAHDTRTTKEYDADGTLTAVSSTTYNDAGDAVLLIWYDETGQETSRCVYGYDDRGLQTSLTWYNPDGTCSGQWLYTYDENGNEIKMEEYDGNGNLISSTIYG